MRTTSFLLLSLTATTIATNTFTHLSLAYHTAIATAPEFLTPDDNQKVLSYQPGCCALAVKKEAIRADATAAELAVSLVDFMHLISD